MPPRLRRETLSGFLGCNLRKDRLSLADGDMARCINADLHSRPGVILARLGRSKQFTTALSASAVRRLHTRSSTRYQVADTTLFRDQTSVLTGLSTTQVTTFVSARPLNDTSTHTFIADDNYMRRDDGTTLRQWGITAPSAAPVIAVGAAGSLTGDYQAVYTYARVVGSSVVHESNPSPTPTAVALTSDVLSVPVIASSDAQVTHIRVYRTVAGGTSLLFDQQVSNATATVTSSQADSALGAAVETDNTAPNVMSWICEFQGHVFGCRDDDYPHYLWWSKRYRPEAFPTSNFLEIGHPNDPLQCAVSLTGFLGVWSRDTKYRVFGNATSGFTFLEALSSRGTPAPNATLTTARGAVFVARDGLWLTNFLEADRELSNAIEPLFHGEQVNDFAPIDWDKAHEMALAEYKNRLYWSYVDTDATRRLAVYSADTGKFYFYDHPARSLYVDEPADQLTMGATDGLVYIIEDTDAAGDAGSAIALTVTTADRAGGDPFTYKRFDYLKVDADAKGGTLTARLYVDGTLKHTASLTGSRTRLLQRLPASCLGHTYRLTFSYSGTARVEIHAAEVHFTPLESA